MRLKQLMKVIKKCTTFFGLGRYNEEEVLRLEELVDAFSMLSEQYVQNSGKFSPLDMQKCMQQYRRGCTIVMPTPQRMRILREWAKDVERHQKERTQAPAQWRKRLINFDRKMQALLMSDLLVLPSSLRSTGN